MTIPENPEAERDVVGALLLSPAYVPEVAAFLEPSDFHTPELGRIFSAIVDLHCRHELVNSATVAHRLGAVNGTRQKVRKLEADCPASAAAVLYATKVRDAARRRRILSAADQLAAAARSADGDVLALAERDLRTVLDDTPAAPVAPAADLDEFLGDADREYDWLLPGLLERGDRLILTGLEGKGKSTLLRQVAVQAASGIHPFSLAPVQPVDVMLVDLENSTRHLRRELRHLRAAAGDDYEKGRLRVETHPEGIDLTSRDGRAWLTSHVVADRPELLVVGPLYKMLGGDPTSEDIARPVAYHLDELRVAHGVAIVLEAHVPHSAGRASARPERPYGASLWCRWPEFGIFLDEDGHLRHWRGARDEREWPAKLKRGGEWPWTLDDNRTAVTFAQILEAQRAAGQKLTMRTLAETVGTSKSTVERAIKANQQQWDALLEELGL